MAARQPILLEETCRHVFLSESLKSPFSMNEFNWEEQVSSSNEFWEAKSTLLRISCVYEE